MQYLLISRQLQCCNAVVQLWGSRVLLGVEKLPAPLTNPARLHLQPNSPLCRPLSPPTLPLLSIEWGVALVSRSLPQPLLHLSSVQRSCGWSHRDCVSVAAALLGLRLKLRPRHYCDHRDIIERRANWWPLPATGVDQGLCGWRR